MSKSITSLTCILVALSLLFVSYVGVIFATFNARIGNGDETAPAIIAVFALFLALLYGLPPARAKLIRLTFPWAARGLFAVLSILLFMLLKGYSNSFFRSKGLDYSNMATHQQALAFVGVLFFLYVLTFILPGFAYRDLRKLRRMEQAHRTQFGLDDQDRSGKKTPLLGTFDRDSATPTHKALSKLAGFTLVPVFGLAGYGVAFAQFIPSQGHVALIDNHFYTLFGGYAAFLAVLFIVLPQTKGRGIFANRLSQKAALVIVGIAMASAIIPAAKTGLPALMSLSEEGRYDSIVVTVVKRREMRKRKGCNYRADVTWDGEKRKLCNVSEYIWEGLRPGQQLELKGFLTDYGFRYEVFERVS